MAVTFTSLIFNLSNQTTIDQFHVTAAIMVQRSIGVKYVIAFVNTSRHNMFVAVMRISSLKEVFMNLLVRKEIDSWLYLSRRS
jgi:hypothetical protein